MNDQPHNRGRHPRRREQAPVINTKKDNDDIINPLDFFDDIDDEMQQEAAEVAVSESAEKNPAQEKSFPRGRGRQLRPRTVEKQGQGRAIFISGTDTGVGKTTAIRVIASLLKAKGLSVGVMKPVQCGGDDAKSLKEFLQLTDHLDEINPYAAKEPFSPHIAFRRERMQVHRDKILSIFHRLRRRHDVLLVEGAGGLLVPIREDYLVADLVKDMELDLVIVARPGLGTINHTLLTIEKARAMGINVRGIVFCETEKKEQGVPEKTNPTAISKIAKVPVLGTIPFLSEISAENILAHCKTKVHLDTFTANPPAKQTKQLAQSDKDLIWHPFTQMKDWLEGEPLIIEKAKDCYLFDTEGRRYLDGVSSLWVNVHGHNHEKINDAIKKQLDRLDHSTFLGLSHTPAIELAKKLIAIAPKGLEKVFYSDNGSTAVEIAVKMSYQYWQNIGRPQKNKIAHLANSYHGDTLGSVSVGGIDLFHKVYQNLIFPTIKIDFPDGYRSENFVECVDKFEQTLTHSREEIAALIIEPLVQGAAGMIVWPDGILKRIKEICEKNEIFLIADEVATGFGRTGKMFACEHEGVTPDFLCLAKGISGGSLPLAATLTTKKVFEGFLFDYKEQKTFFHGHTYTANPVACAAALANLEIFSHEHTLAKIQPKIKFLGEKLKMFYNLPHVGQVRHKGLMVGIELVRNKETKEPFLWEEKIGVKVCQDIRRRGVILRPLGNVIVLMPPLSISIKELEYLLRVTYSVIRNVGRNSNHDKQS